MEKVKKQIRKLQGVIISNKMDKTVIVKVDSVKVHSKYKKRYKSSKNYKVHDEKNEYQVGDKVTIKEIRPLSKEKRFLVIKKI